MKDFIKVALATVVGLALFCTIGFFLFISTLGAIAGLSETKPTVPSSAILSIDLSKIIISEQSQDIDALSVLKGNGMDISSLGIHDIIKTINTAALDPSITLIYLKPDAVMGGMAQIEELRTALANFRMSGKAVVSFVESPSNAGMYLASVSDKIYMTPYDGGMNMFTGASSQMIFLKDLLDRLGINVQLIRHGKYKSAGEMFINSAPSKDNLEQNKAIIESIWSNWSNTIAESRDMNSEELNSMLANLELNFPEDFLEKGLVDELVSREELIGKLSNLSGQLSTNPNLISLNDYKKARTAVENNLLKSKIAVIYLDGEIIDGDGYEQIASNRFAKIIADVRNDSSVKAAVIRVNSPGGSVLAAEKILAEIELLQQNIPVVASFGNYAASGGYWISAGCNKIYSDATTLTGSIGVFSMVPDFSKTIENKLHVNIVNVNSNKHSDMYGMMRPLDNAEIKYMQNSVEKIYDRFTSIVADGRDLSIEQVEKIAQGRVWTGAQALEIGLVDEIGTIEDAIDWAIDSVSIYVNLEDIAIEAYPKPLSDWEIILKQFEGAEQNILAGTPFKNVGEAFLSWTESQAGKVYARVPYEYIIK